jgi:hypothetical protein
LAASRETAWKEVTSRWGADPAAYWMAEVRVRLTKVADLTDPATRVRYGVDELALTEARHDRCQKLADRLREEGYEGAWTFSRADRATGRQLVVFLDRVSSGSGVRVQSVKPLREVLPRP